MAMNIADFVQAGAVAAGRAPMQSAYYGGQGGPIPVFSEIFGAGAGTNSNMRMLVLTAPTGLEDLPSGMGDVFRAWAKHYWERRVTEVTGLSFGLKSNFEAKSQVSGVGEWASFTGVEIDTFEEVSTKLVDAPGRPNQNLLTDFIHLFFGNEFSKVIPQITTLEGADYDPKEATHPQWRTFTVLFYTLDITGTVVDKACIGYNMAPKSNGTDEMKYDVKSGAEAVELDVAWTIFPQRGFGVRELAQTLHDKIRRAGTNPYLALPAVTEIDSLVSEVTTGTSYAADVLAETGVTRA